MIGKTLAHYEITALLGKGGMGEVYRATDTKLGREVALKVLPMEVAADPERAARFEREARVLASLQHANIASIYGFENVDGVRFLTMELAAGDDLAQRLERGKLPIDDVVEIATQIAIGLEAAHQSGIVHRDLKPANIKVDASGVVKILDFGLARAFSGDPEDSDDLANSPTISVAMTQAGIILGTAAYMSPEQAKGKAVDSRSDIWSFGVLVFEMLSGKRLFVGETVSETMAEVMKGSLDWSALPDDTPEWLERLLRRCLDRDPQSRLQSIGEARIAIERKEDRPSAATPEIIRSSSPWGWIAVGIGLVAFAAAMIYNGRQETPDAPLVRSVLLPPEDHFFAVDSPFAVSPDGRRIAFTATASPRAAASRGGIVSLWIRDLGELEAREIPGTEGAQYPFWSPDGRQIAFFNDDSLSKVDSRGGPVVRLSDSQSGRGGTWNEDGTIVYQRNWSEGLMKIPAGGGTPEPITMISADRADIAHRWPQFLPDGRRFLFFVVNTTSFAASEHSGVYLGSLDSDETRMILRGESRALYSQGHLLYRVSSTLMAHAIDEDTMELRGDPVPVAADIAGGGISWGGGHFGVSSNGLLVSLNGSGATYSNLVWRDREGLELGFVGEASNYAGFDLSADGTRVVVADGTHTSDLWIFDIDRGVRTRFTFDPADDRSPIWSPGDSSIAFVSAREGVGEIYVRPVSGSREPTLIHATQTSTVLSDWSRDGRWILYQSLSLGSDSWDVKAFDNEEKVEITVLGGPFVQSLATLSPDGRWVAYTSDESARQEIYVQPFPSGPGRWMVSVDGGTRPIWSNDGRELVFFGPEGSDVYAVPVEVGDSFSFGAPVKLFNATLRTGSGNMSAMSADGQRFLANESGQLEAGVQSAGLVQNWTRLLDR